MLEVARNRESIIIEILIYYNDNEESDFNDNYDNDNTEDDDDDDDDIKKFIYSKALCYDQLLLEKDGKFETSRQHTNTYNYRSILETKNGKKKA